MEHFDPEEFLALVERYRVTVTQVVPTMFIRMLKLPESVRAKYDVSSLRSVVHAAAPCPVDVKRQMIEWWGPIIHEYYAGTEGNGFVYTGSDGVAGAPGHRGPGHPRHHPHRRRRRQRAAAPASRARSTSRAARDFEYHNDAEKTAGSRNASGLVDARRRRLPRRRAATSTSPTARRS